MSLCAAIPAVLAGRFNLTRQAESRHAPLPKTHDTRETIENWRLHYDDIRHHSSFGCLTLGRCVAGHANVYGRKRSPYLHSLDGFRRLNLQLDSIPSDLAYAD